MSKLRIIIVFILLFSFGVSNVYSSNIKGQSSYFTTQIVLLKEQSKELYQSVSRNQEGITKKLNSFLEPTSTIDLINSDLELGVESEAQLEGMRYNNITIPQRATKNRKIVEFKSGEATNELLLNINNFNAATSSFSCSSSILSNQNFESGNANWSFQANTSISNDAHFDSKAAYADGGTGGPTQTIAANPDEIYALSVYAKKNATESVSIGIKYLDTNDVEIDAQYVSVTSSTYTEYALSMKAPANTAYVQVLGWKDAGSGKAWWDGFCLEKWTITPPSCSSSCDVMPSFNNYVWSIGEGVYDNFMDYDDGGLIFCDNGDSTMSIKGTIINGRDADWAANTVYPCGSKDGWSVNLTLSDMQSWAEFQGDYVVSSNCSNAYLDLDYWDVSGTLTGLGCNAGRTLDVSGPSTGNAGDYRLQIGEGGNSHGCGFGMSTWFEVTENGNPIYMDIYAELNKPCYISLRPPPSTSNCPNLIANSELDNGIAYWNFWADSGSGANATRSIDSGSELSGTNSAAIDISSVSGTDLHIQYYQSGKSLIAGKEYSVSFDAKAAATRNIKVGMQLGGAPFTGYFSETVSLTTTGQTYTYTFTASETISNNVTFYFSFGQSIHNIWIDNVVFKEVCTTSEICNNNIDDDGDGLIDSNDPDCANCSNTVTNNEFDNGTTDWLIFTSGAAEANLTTDNSSQLSGSNSGKVNISALATNDYEIQLWQGNKSIEAGKIYTFSFEAKAAAARNIGLMVQLDVDPWTTYLERSAALTTTSNTYTYTFHSNHTLSGNVNIIFSLGETQDVVWVDNVFFGEKCEDYEICDNGIDDDGDGLIDCDDPDCSLLSNGGIEELTSSSFTTTLEGNPAHKLLNGETLPEWSAGLSGGCMYYVNDVQGSVNNPEGDYFAYLHEAGDCFVNNMKFEDLVMVDGEDYTISFHAASWDISLDGSCNPDGGSGTQGVGRVKIEMENHNYVSSVVADINIPQSTSWSNLNWQKIKHTFTYNASNQNNFAITNASNVGLAVDGVILSKADCLPPTSEICDNNIDDDGDGLIDSNDPDCADCSNTVTNNEFDNGTTDWLIFTSGAAEANLTTDNSSQLSGSNSGKVNISALAANDYEIQLWQGNKSIEAGKIYTFSFEAKAAAARNIGLMVQLDVDPWTTYLERSVALTTTSNTYTYTFHSNHTLSGNVNIIFSLGETQDVVWVDNVFFGEKCEDYEICDNGIDDDGDGLIDCDDPDCSLLSNGGIEELTSSSFTTTLEGNPAHKLLNGETLPEWSAGLSGGCMYYVNDVQGSVNNPEGDYFAYLHEAGDCFVNNMKFEDLAMVDGEDYTISFHAASWDISLDGSCNPDGGSGTQGVGRVKIEMENHNYVSSVVADIYIPQSTSWSNLNWQKIKHTFTYNASNQNNFAITNASDIGLAVDGVILSKADCVPTTPEICDNGIDDDGDGVTDIDCPCTGNQITAVSQTNTGVANPNNAVGLSNGEYADLRSGDVLTLDLGEQITAGGIVQIYIARGNDNGRVTIAGSTSASSGFAGNIVWGNPANSNTTVDATKAALVYEIVDYTVPTGGLRYIRFTRNSGQIRVDGVKYCSTSSEICDNNTDDDGDGLTDCADSDCQTIALSTPTVSACIDQPLRDVATVSVNITWTNAPANDDIEVKLGDKIETIFVSSGATSPHTIEFITIADGSTGNTITAEWKTSTNYCNATVNFDAPTACSNDELACKILYLCGLDKPYDGDSWDHGFMTYVDEMNGASAVDGILTKADGSGMGTYDIDNQTNFVNVTLSDYDLIIISATTEAHIASDLVNVLKNYEGSILNSNYLLIDDLGLSGSAGGYTYQTNAYTDNTTSEEIYNYDNINPSNGYVFTHGDYTGVADGHLWTSNNNQSTGSNSIIFHYEETDALSGISGAHGTRTYLGYHMNGIYANSVNGGALPAPVATYFSPEKHLTLKGKELFDQALILAASGCIATEICDNNIDDDGDGLIDSIDPDCPVNQSCNCSSTNLLDNPSFETGTFVGNDVFIPGVNSDYLGWNWGTPSGLDGWSHGQLWWVDAPTKATDGSKIVYINNENGGPVCQGEYYDIGLGIDEISTCATYQLCFDWASFNRDNPNGRSTTSRPAMDLTWFDANGTDLGATHQTLGVEVANQDWDNLIWSSVSYSFQLTGTFAPPANATRVRVNISEESGHDNGILVDNANLCVTTSCEVEICDNNIDDDGDGLIDCEDDDCLAGLTLDIVEGNCVDNGNDTYTTSYLANVTWANPPAGVNLEVSLDGNVLTTIDPATDNSPQAISFDLNADGNGTHTILAKWTGNLSCELDTVLLAPLPCPPVVSNLCNQLTNTQIGGSIFEDWNYDGVMNESTIVGVQGVSILAYNENNDLIASAYPDVNGNYLLDGLVAGGFYRVEFVLSSSTAATYTITNPGANNGTFVQFLTAGSCADVGLSNETLYCTHNPITPCPEIPISIGNYVWYDTDGNGIQDADEQGIEGVILQLYNTACELIAIDTTDADGNYYFTDEKLAAYTAHTSNVLTANTTYHLVLTDLEGGSFDSNTQLLLWNNEGYGLTNALQGSNTSIDANAVIATNSAACSGTTENYPLITIALGDESNFTFDIGFVKKGEICDNGIDDDGDGNIDNCDADCNPTANIIDGCITVNSTGDEGDTNPGDGRCITVNCDCTLRAAIEEANALAGKDTICFDIPGPGMDYDGTKWTITPMSLFENLTEAVFIDGYTQTGSAEGTNSATATLKININGENLPANGAIFQTTADGNKLAGMVISGNDANGRSSGVSLQSSNNEIVGNFIGVTVDGATAFANGIGVIVNGSNNKIGGTNASDANIIAQNVGAGLEVVNTGSNGNIILRNSFTENGSIGIDLASGNIGDAVTANDANDLDDGANNLLNFPELKGIAIISGEVYYDFILDVPAGDYRIEFYSNAAADPTGHGEGKTFIGILNINHTGNGQAPFYGNFTPLVATPIGSNITLTATQCTDASCTAYYQTSEFNGSYEAERCDDLTDPGSIIGDEEGCGIPFNPSTINSVAAGSGGEGGAVYYQWQYKEISSTEWQDIVGATSIDYTPAAISITTSYRRRAIRARCSTTWQTSNEVTKTVFNGVIAEISEAPSGSNGYLCGATAYQFAATDAGVGATYEWYFGENANPATATGAGPITVGFLPPTDSLPVYNKVTLSVTKNGCVSTDTASFSVHPVVFTTDIQPTNPNTCGGTQGSIEITAKAQKGLCVKVSLDGGNTYQPDGVLSFTNLSAGSYHVVLNYCNTECPMDYGFVTLEEPTNIIAANDVIEDSCPGFKIEGNVAYNDRNIENTIYTVESNPTKGVVSMEEDGVFEYRSTVLECGTDQFAYRVCNTVTGCCATAIVNLSFEDNVAPELKNVPDDMTVNCDEEIPLPPLVSAFDNCPAISIDKRESNDQGEDGCSLYDYTITRTWIATDVCGNTASDVQQVKVQDITAPDIFRIYTLPNGKKMVAGVMENVSQHWKTIQFPIDFPTVPVVFTQVVSTIDSTVVATRMRNISIAQFDLKLQEEEANDGIHGGEKVAWIAIEEGANVDGFKLEVGRLAANHTYNDVNFVNNYGGKPAAFASLQSTRESDVATVRCNNLTATGIDLKVEEETSADAETDHTTEIVGYLAVDSLAFITNDAGAIIGEVGTVSMNAGIMVVSSNNYYYNPVIITKFMDQNSTDPTLINTRILSNNSFEITIDGWDYQSEVEPIGKVAIMIVEGSLPLNIDAACLEGTDSLVLGVDIVAIDNCDNNVTINFEETVSYDGPAKIITRVYSSVDECGNATELTQTVHCEGVMLRTKALLQGSSINSEVGLMRDDLRKKNLIPTEEPYTALEGFRHFGTGGREQIDPALLAIEGNNAIVDWVLIELRDKTNPSKVVTTQSGLIQRDGDVVTVDGDSIMFFENVRVDDYYVSIKHRNHLAMYSLYTQRFGPAIIPFVDFTNVFTPVMGEVSGVEFGGKRAMWSGDINSDSKIIFQGPQNDIFQMFMHILLDDGNGKFLTNFISQGYTQRDFNMDGKVIYQGPENDRSTLLYHTVLKHPRNGTHISNFVVQTGVESDSIIIDPEWLATDECAGNYTLDGCDFDGDGLVNEADFDKDGDGVPDSLDLNIFDRTSDSDGDGISDDIETGGDGQYDIGGTDSNPLDACDPVPMAACIGVDEDGDGYFANYPVAHSLYDEHDNEACSPDVNVTNCGCKDDDGDGKIVVCHIPGNNYGNRITKKILLAAYLLHIGHGDVCGPCNYDEDGDGVEEPNDIDPNDPNSDSDGDGILDYIETGQDGKYDVGVDMDPLNPDTDGDGLTDGEEDANQNGIMETGESDPMDFCNPENTTPACDFDGDGQSNQADNDDDNDGVWDVQDADPFDKNSDSDNDGVTDFNEYGTSDPLNACDPVVVTGVCLGIDEDGDGYFANYPSGHSAYDPNDTDECVPSIATASTFFSPVPVSKDNYLEEKNPYNNHGRANELVLQVEENENSHALLHFDVSEINQDLVTGAKLKLYIEDADDLTIQVYKMSKAWQEGLWVNSLGLPNWKDKAFLQQWTTAGGDYFPTVYGSKNITTEGDWVEINLPKALILNWINNTSSNYGILLKGIAAGDSNGQIVFRSKETSEVSNRPYLELELSTSHCSASGQSGGGDGGASGTDSDGDGIYDHIEMGADGQYDFGIDTNPYNPDTDGDGIDDGVEDANKNGAVDTGESNPRSGCDPNATGQYCDFDGDGWINLFDWDDDGDSVNDFADADKFDPNSDTDGDGITDILETGADGVYNTDTDSNPLEVDTDGDGIDDGVEDSNKNGEMDAGESNPADACSPNPSNGGCVGIDADGDGHFANYPSNHNQFDPDDTDVNNPNNNNTTVTVTTGIDTYIKEKSINRGENHGKVDVIHHKARANDHINGLIQFDLGGHSGKNVVSATLYMYLERGNGGGNTIEAHRITTLWEEGIQDGWAGTCNWDEATSTNSWTNSGGDYNTSVEGSMTTESVGYKSMTLSAALVQDWLDNSSNNFGLMLLSAGGNPDKDIEFTSFDGANGQKPYLEIVFSEGSN